MRKGLHDMPLPATRAASSPFSFVVPQPLSVHSENVLNRHVFRAQEEPELLVMLVENFLLDLADNAFSVAHDKAAWLGSDHLSLALYTREVAATIGPNHSRIGPVSKDRY